MVAHALAFTEPDTGQRPISVGVRDAFRGVTAGGRLVRTTRGFALFDEEGRFVGMIQTPETATRFGPAGPTMLLKR